MFSFAKIKSPHHSITCLLVGHHSTDPSDSLVKRTLSSSSAGVVSMRCFNKVRAIEVQDT